MNEFIIMTRNPALSGKAREFGAGYRKIALVEIDRAKLRPGDSEPRMISERARGVVRIVSCQSVYWGKGIRSEGRHYLDYLRQRRLELTLAAHGTEQDWRPSESIPEDHYA